MRSIEVLSVGVEERLELLKSRDMGEFMVNESKCHISVVLMIIYARVLEENSPYIMKVFKYYITYYRYAISLLLPLSSLSLSGLS